MSITFNNEEGFLAGTISSSRADLFIVTSGSVVISSSATPDKSLRVEGDVKVIGDVVAENYVVSSSVTHFTQSFSSGNTKFGDTPADDTHQFTGSVSITGSNGLIVNGNINTSGEFQGNLKTIKNSGFFLNSNHTSKNFIPLAGSLEEGTTDQYFHMMIAPYRGRLVKVYAHPHSGDPGDLTIGLHTGSFDSAAHLETNSVQDIVVGSTVDDRTYVFRFSSSIAKYDEGDMIGISIQQSTSNNSSYTVTSVWEYDTSVESFNNT